MNILAETSSQWPNSVWFGITEVRDGESLFSHFYPSFQAVTERKSLRHEAWYKAKGLN